MVQRRFLDDYLYQNQLNLHIFFKKKPGKLIEFPQNLQHISYFSLKCIYCSNFSPMCILLICSIYSNSSHARVLLGSSDTILKADTLGCSIFLFLHSVFWITVCPFSLSYCVVCPSLIYRFWLPLWYLQTLLSEWKELVKTISNWYLLRVKKI